MSSNTLGIVIIIGIIIIAIATGGDIFRHGPITISPENRNGNVSETYDDNTNSSRYGLDGGVLGDQSRYYDRNSGDSIFDKVSITNVYNPGRLDEYITLSVYLDKDESIILTGWKLRSVMTGQEVLIGGAARVPIVGLTDQTAIQISGAESRSNQVSIIIGRSPINTSFRLNSCMGFLEEEKHFEPAIYSSCPRAIEYAPALSANFDDDCLDYIEGLPRCEVPRERDYKDLGLSRSCRDFLNTKINYANCIVNNIRDEEFFLNKWYVYTNTRGAFGLKERDTIQLIDRAGVVISSYDI